MLVKPHLILILLIKMYQNWTRIDFVNILFLQFVLYMKYIYGELEASKYFRFLSVHTAVGHNSGIMIIFDTI